MVTPLCCSPEIRVSVAFQTSMFHCPHNARPQGNKNARFGVSFDSTRVVEWMGQAAPRFSAEHYMHCMGHIWIHLRQAFNPEWCHHILGMTGSLPLPIGRSRCLHRRGPNGHELLRQARHRRAGPIVQPRRKGTNRSERHDGRRATVVCFFWDALGCLVGWMG